MFDWKLYILKTNTRIADNGLHLKFFFAEFFGALNLIFLARIAASELDFSSVGLVSEKLLGIRLVFCHD